MICAIGRNRLSILSNRKNLRSKIHLYCKFILDNSSTVSVGIKVTYTAVGSAKYGQLIAK